MPEIDRHSIIATRISSARGLVPWKLLAPEGRGPSGTMDRALRIIIVEDDYFIALQNQTVLENLEHEVLGVAATFDDAVRLAELKRPDLVIMDIRLSGPADGIDAAKEIMNRFGIRSLFVSAYADDFMRNRAEPARPLGWLTKPFTIEEFSASVRAAVERLKLPEN